MAKTESIYKILMDKWDCSRTTVYNALTGKTRSGLARCLREDYDKIKSVVS